MRILFIDIILIGCIAAFAAAAFGQSSVPVRSSELTSAVMPTGAERLAPDSIPEQFGQAFDSVVRAGKGQFAGGDREVLAWSGNYGDQQSSAAAMSRIQTSFRKAGWTFESQGKVGDLETFSLLREGMPKRLVYGFFVFDDKVFVCSLMELIKPGTGNALEEAKPADTASGTPTRAKIVTADRDTQWVNVMGSEMPAIPDFPKLAPKPGRARGYVKDWSGKPLAGADIGVRSSYLAGFYSGAQGKTDANGYYEIVVPNGSAHFYNAGYQINWGDGVAAVSLHPADGVLDPFATIDGAVENFVLLPYGMTSRENLQESPHLPSTFYGGAISFNWYSADADDNNAPHFALRTGSTLEVTLMPDGPMLDGSAGRPIIVRKVLGPSSAFRVHNIPLGTYRISVRVDGRPIQVKDNKKYPEIFGMAPAETTGEAKIVFVPDEAKASMIIPQHGAWKWIGLSLSTP
jgi:hypothetical protein